MLEIQEVLRYGARGCQRSGLRRSSDSIRRRYAATWRPPRRRASSPGWTASATPSSRPCCSACTRAAAGRAGQEVQVDTGWVGRLTLPGGIHRRFRAWIFTPVCSRYRFVYPTFEETTTRAIEACEAAWRFYGGVFTVIIPDNTPAIITTADDLATRINPVFLEYAQARHFHIDAARARHPRDKARVERSVSTVRDDAFLCRRKDLTKPACRRRRAGAAPAGFRASSRRRGRTDRRAFMPARSAPTPPS
jgi:transposase